MTIQQLPHSATLLALVAGIASHLFYFRIGEHHLYGILYIQLFILANAVGTISLIAFSDATRLEAAVTVSKLAASWLVGVYGSLITYRLFFHPLNKFPGPWQARISDLWLSSNMGDMQGYYFIHNLHKKYGRYVRVGSNTLSITDPLIMQPAYGSQAKAIKGDWYDVEHPRHSMQTVRDRTLHDRRRRVWAPGFSDKALREYEPTVHELNEKLANQLGNLKGQSANMSTWFNLYGFDVMSRLAFGKDFGMVESGKRHWALDLLTEGIKSSAYRLPCWVFRLIIAIPGGGKGFKKFLTFCIEQVKWRVENKETAGKDIFSWLLKAHANEPHPEDDVNLQADARLIILAGSDTTSATLTYLFYRLAKEPGHIEKLREELRPLTQGEWSDKDISHAKHLNGVINETLRLHPAVPSGLPRKIVKEGAQVGDVFLPGETGFFNPLFAMARDEGIYEDAESFVAER